MSSKILLKIINQNVLHLCTFKTPPKGGVISEQGDADCAFLMRNGVKKKIQDLKLKIVVLKIIVGEQYI